MKTEYRANQALQDQSAREQARRAWGNAQGRYDPTEELPELGSWWYWAVTLTPIVLVSAWALVAFLEPSWLIALAEYIK